MGEEGQEREGSRCDDSDVGSDDGGEGNVVAGILWDWGYGPSIYAYGENFQAVSAFGFLALLLGLDIGSSPQHSSGLLIQAAFNLDGVAHPGGGFARRRR